MCVGFYSENGATLRNHPGHYMAVCGLSLHLGSSESRKTLEQKSTSAFHSINLFLERDVFSSCEERGTKKKNFFESSDSDDDFRSGFRNVSHHYGQQSFSGLHLPGRSNYTITHVTEM